jgi:nitric oxide reductase subunit B
MSKKFWWQPLFFVFVVGLAGVMFMGIRTYQDAPPIPDFTNTAGQILISQKEILQGQEVFQKYALMDYGSMFGDGASRGPDFTADALHQIAVAMNEYYAGQAASDPPTDSFSATQAAVEARVKSEIKQNQYDSRTNQVVLTDGQSHAYQQVIAHYRDMFLTDGPESLHPASYISDPAELKDLAAFFYWGGWVCGARRPDAAFSYTHNWPYDELAGNTPTAPVLLWSVFGALGLILALGGVLYARGRLDKLVGLKPNDKSRAVTTVQDLTDFAPAAIQRSTYKFFAVAAILFLLQVLAGALTIHDFVGLTRFAGIEISTYLPVTIVRSWHVQLSLMWITACWIGASVFVLPMISEEQPKGQVALIDLLFALLMLVVAGSTVGVFLGPTGALGQWWHLLGHQGWEFVELGKLWQVLLFAVLGLWALIVFRGARPILQGPEPLALPNWMFYSILAVLVLFCSGFVATPRTNFVIADFWRWCVIHMWVEAFFEVFTTAVVAYFMYLMGLVTKNSAARVVYLAALLFLGSGILGVSHNFYWNAKPVVTLALGSIFSTLQVVPLILLTLEAWRFRQMPQSALKESGSKGTFGQSEAFLFLLGVNFWNFVGAGVFGFIINLPMINYYEHGTYLTVNHGHAALMGVYGNLAIAAMLFCSRYLVPEGRWNEGLLRCVFWSINIGLMLMVIMDLFPVGIIQLATTLDHGLWFSRSQEFIKDIPFQTLTWMRAVGGYLFLLGGVIPLVHFMTSRAMSLKPEASPCEPAAALAVHAEPDLAGRAGLHRTAS